jgi:DnaJ-class molecular chaperone
MSDSPYERAHFVLGLQPGANVARIHDQYRFLAFVFHPDRVPSGSMRERVERHLKEINNARDYLVKYHEENAPVETDSAPNDNKSDAAQSGRWWQPPPGYGGSQKTAKPRRPPGYWEDGEWHGPKGYAD